jgi:hypothetical protein
VRTISLGVGTLIVAVLLTVYATGPSTKASGKVCNLGPNAIADAIFAAGRICVLHGHHAYFTERTNAWERLKGAITGSP